MEEEPELAQVAYEAYCAATGGRSAISGDPLPDWQFQLDNRPEVVAGWRAAAEAVRVTLNDVADKPYIEDKENRESAK